MTKIRMPLSFENSLDRIIKRIGLKHAGRVAGVAERTLHDWTDPDSPRTPPIAAALRLDRAWQDAGGEGSPLFDTWRRLAERPAPAPSLDLSQTLCVVFREAAEAKEAVFLATQPGATSAHRLNAAREVEEALTAFGATLPHLLPAMLTT